MPNTTPDFLLAQTDLASSASSCRGSTIRSYRTATLGAGADVASDALVDSGVIGPFDTTRGDDLAVYVMPLCTGETGAFAPAALRIYRLTDGTPLATLPAVEQVICRARSPRRSASTSTATAATSSSRGSKTA